MTKKRSSLTIVPYFLISRNFQPLTKSFNICLHKSKQHACIAACWLLSSGVTTCFHIMKDVRKALFILPTYL